MNKVHKVIIDSFLLENEREKFNNKLSNQELNNDYLLKYLIDENIVLLVDWSGEEEENQIGNFLQKRINRLGGDVKLDFEEANEKLSKEIKKNKIERGDAVPFLLKHFQRIIKKLGYDINLIDFKNDTYYIFLADRKNTNILKRINDEFWDFYPFGSRKGMVLYVVNCDCGSMNVWEMKVTDPSPVDEECDSCNKPLFDKEGNELLPVIKEYY